MIVDWAGKYIGLEYELGSKGPRTFDCWGLMVWIYKQEFNLDIGEGVFYLTKQDRAIQLEQHLSKWTKVNQPSMGDGILFTIGGKIPHCGLYIGDNLMLHTVDERLSCIERVTSPKWKSRLEGYYHYL